MLVYVLNKNGKPLMPCSPCKAKKLLQAGVAKVIRKEPFTIQLVFGSAGYKQKVIVGCDSGSKVAAFSATANQKVIYLSEVKLRNDIRSNMDQKTSL